MPAHATEDDPPGAGEPPLPGGPIHPDDVDRIVMESSGVTPNDTATAIRAWRDALTLVHDALVYAGVILGADVATLRRCLGARASDARSVVDELPRVLASGPWGEGWSTPGSAELSSGIDPELVTRADPLLSAHGEMARVDLTSRRDLTRVIRLLEAQLAEVISRQSVVETRLGEIRAAIVRHYRDGAVPSLGRPA
jgi:hypothetical protein